ncbi:hypothetical protein KQX54_004880 [Cotesia glomerata]|uniref:Uncharacterized protein n=1 Tax=Cotesia glomerata TaxID=32391 RepID=A0AAV7IPW5_COTGL|nr:hypothetical protein KQX54_004880 [Cotesia glomerata]
MNEYKERPGMGKDWRIKGRNKTTSCTQGQRWSDPDVPITTATGGPVLVRTLRANTHAYADPVLRILHPTSSSGDSRSTVRSFGICSC